MTKLFDPLFDHTVLASCSNAINDLKSKGFVEAVVISSGNEIPVMINQKERLVLPKPE